MLNLSAFGRGWLIVAVASTACQPAASAPTLPPATPTAAVPSTRTPKPEPVETAEPTPIALTSSSFEAQAEIPDRFACPSFGENVSPALSWGPLPSGTQSLALLVTDPDAGQFIHWLVAGIPADAAGFAEGQIPAGAVEGTTGIGEPGWFGPCPDTTHRYVFALYALDIVTDLEPGFGLIDFRMATDGHIIGQGQRVGLYTP